MSTENQILTALKEPPPQDALSTRQEPGRTLTYLEGHYVIAKANEIFGPLQWRREFVGEGLKEVHRWQGKPPKKSYDRYDVAYTCAYRVTVCHDGLNTVTEDIGYGIGQSYNNFGDATESAVKEAVTDALKRCFRSLGNAFGNCLYDKQWLAGNGHKGEGGNATPPSNTTQPTCDPDYRNQCRIAMTALCKKASVPVLAGNELDSAVNWLFNMYKQHQDPLIDLSGFAAYLDKVPEDKALGIISKWFEYRDGKAKEQNGQ